MCCCIHDACTFGMGSLKPAICFVCCNPLSLVLPGDPCDIADLTYCSDYCGCSDSICDCLASADCKGDPSCQGAKEALQSAFGCCL